MPYLPDLEKTDLDCGVREPETPGELNYVLTEKALRYLEHKRDTTGQRLGYSDLNEVVGVFECAKGEFQRRVLHPYEDDRIRDNGDVF